MDDVVARFWKAKSAENIDINARDSGRIKAHEHLASIAKQYLSKKDAITIDLGCGTGLFAEVSGTRHITGVDFSPTLLRFARRRMDKVVEQDIFDLKFPESSIDNIISLFVIDDYPPDRKRIFFRRASLLLKPGGHFFFTAYSPNDERMGKLRGMVNPKGAISLEVFLETSAFYENTLLECDLAIETSEILRTEGQFKVGPSVQRLKREFIIVSATKETATSISND